MEEVLVFPLIFMYSPPPFSSRTNPHNHRTCRSGTPEGIEPFPARNVGN